MFEATVVKLGLPEDKRPKQEFGQVGIEGFDRFLLEVDLVLNKGFAGVSVGTTRGSSWAAQKCK